ncbi:hypothetical protein [Pseudomonas alcaligenes]|uniref:hypothetical protein n=1 Tax=Aquipseudomonas alcaligenes TaxID=43263 RepID=UPI00358E4429
MTDFDFDKPYGASWKTKLATAIGVTANTLVALADTGLFVTAISVLWGWYFIGLGSCLVLLVLAIDRRADLRRLIRRQPLWHKSERIYLIYFFALVAVAIVVNLVFVVLFITGNYEPPFGGTPIGYAA